MKKWDVWGWLLPVAIALPAMSCEFGDNDHVTPFRIAGKVTYDYVSAEDSVEDGGGGLAYASEIQRPVRRASVLAIEDGAILVRGITDDAGAFSLDIPGGGHSVTLRVAAESVVSTNAPDGVGPENCRGASWDVQIIDNTSLGALYVLEGTTAYDSNAMNVALNASLSRRGATYGDRAAAPFAILDTVLAVVELVCEGQTDLTLPSLHVNWSVNNTNLGGNLATGFIGTSFYQRDEAGQSNLYILGKEGVDTDEFDDHVIAHETGHFIEDRLFRSDSVGGSHGNEQTIDPTVAFGEGFGNALSGMVFNDPTYVDTSGPAQRDVFAILVDVAPEGNDRGVYSETSIQYLLWSLFNNRSPGHGTFERIYNILANFEKATPSHTSGLAFASYYNQVYGGVAEQLQPLWENDLATSFHALCVGACSGFGDTADPFDTDNDIGAGYATSRRYPQTDGLLFSAEFWRLYRTLDDGVNVATDHDRLHFGRYEEPWNAFGAQRWYRYVATADGMLTINVENLGASNCETDVLDMQVRARGVAVGFDGGTTGPTAGCPLVRFMTAAGATYTIVVAGSSTELPSFDLKVTR